MNSGIGTALLNERDALRIALDAVTLKSALSLAYLVVFGSLVGYTAFIWLLKVDRASRVVTHTFVNPIVAIILGWSLGDEAISGGMLAASAVIILSVMIIIRCGLKEDAPVQ